MMTCYITTTSRPTSPNGLASGGVSLCERCLTIQQQARAIVNAAAQRVLYIFFTISHDVDFFHTPCLTLTLVKNESFDHRKTLMAIEISHPSALMGRAHLCGKGTCFSHSSEVEMGDVQ